MANLPRISPFGDRESLNSLSVEEFVPPSAWTEDQTCHYLLVDLPGFKKQELKLQVDNQTHIVVSGERQVRENKFKRFEQRFELPNNAHIDKISGKLDGEILYISVPKKVEHEHQVTKHDGIHGGKTAMSDDGEDDDGDDDKEEKSDDDGDDDKEEKSDDDGDDDKEEKSDDDGDDDKEEKSYANENEEESDNKDEKDLERNKHQMEFDEDWGKEADLYLRLAIEKLIKNKEIVITAIFAFSLGVLVSQKFQSDGH